VNNADTSCGNRKWSGVLSVSVVHLRQIRRFRRFRPSGLRLPSVSSARQKQAEIAQIAVGVNHHSRIPGYVCEIHQNV